MIKMKIDSYNYFLTSIFSSFLSQLRILTSKIAILCTSLKRDIESKLIILKILFYSTGKTEQLQFPATSSWSIKLWREPFFDDGLRVIF